jgi:carbon storage regulator
MLILSRRPNESFLIGDDVVVTVVGFSGSQIRLGISAPPNVIIDREEVHLRKLAERIPTLSPATTPAAPPSGSQPAAQKTGAQRPSPLRTG